MRILILGASGRVGGQVLKNALQNGHKVTALVRTPEKLQIISENLTIIKGNVLIKTDLMEALGNNDVIISALSTDGTTTLSASFPLIIKTMKIHGLKRIITVGTAGILKSRIVPQLLRYQSKESRHKSTRATEEHHKVYDLLKQSDLEWTIICPTYLSKGDYTGRYRVEKYFLPQDGTSISIPDVADFTYKQLNNKEYVKSRVGIAY